MSLTLYLHPLSSYCQKVLIALYEAGIPFAPKLVESADDWQALRAISPLGKIPLLLDDGRAVAETSVIVEYLSQHFEEAARLIPRDSGGALAVRYYDRFYDLYVMTPMQAVIKQRLRPTEKRDPLATDEAKADLRSAYDAIESDLRAKTWAAGDEFTMADCAAAPALYYANEVVPFPTSYAALRSYFERLSARPSVARVFREAEPYRHMFPRES
jgi:glutathione S-transferase